MSLSLSIGPLVSLIAGILILVMPRLLSTTGPSDQVLPQPEDQRETETEPLPTGQELVEQSLKIGQVYCIECI